MGNNDTTPNKATWEASSSWKELHIFFVNTVYNTVANLFFFAFKTLTFNLPSIEAIFPQGRGLLLFASVTFSVFRFSHSRDAVVFLSSPAALPPQKLIVWNYAVCLRSSVVHFKSLLFQWKWPLLFPLCAANCWTIQFTSHWSSQKG